MNGKGEWVRWIAGIVVAVLLSYAALKEDLAVVKTNEANHYAELLRLLSDNQRENREFRNEIRQMVEETRGIVKSAVRGVDRQTGEPVLLQHSIDQGKR
jgi:hypothetical protein